MGGIAKVSSRREMKGWTSDTKKRGGAQLLIGRKKETGRSFQRVAALFCVTKEVRSPESMLGWKLGNECKEHLQCLEQLPSG